MAYDGKFWVSFDGTILNHVSLRSQLSHYGHQFRTESDTEVVLAAYAQWGTDCFKRLRGSWALVLVDLLQNRVILCRDRFGIKPLFYTEASKMFFVASEIKQLKAARIFLPNESAIFNYLLGKPDLLDATFFKDIYPVPAGHWMSIDISSLERQKPESYWNPAVNENSVDDIEEASTRLRSMLIASTELNLRTTPVWGCELSGGLSSSTIVACADALTQSAVRTFSVTYPGHPMDKSDDIHLMIKALGAHPKYMTPTVGQVAQDFDQFVFAQDEPVNSLVQFVSYELARVVNASGLSSVYLGNGGDEIFSSSWDDYFAHFGDQLRAGRFMSVAIDLLGASLVDGNHELLWQLPSVFRRNTFGKSQSVLEDHQEVSISAETSESLKNLSFSERRAHHLRKHTLPGMLRCTDRNHMAFSIEPRYPFLDHTLVEFCLKFDRSLLYRNGWTHNALRVAFEDMLPADFTLRRHETAKNRIQSEWIFRALQPAMKEMLADSEAPVWHYLDQKKVDRLHSQVFGRPELNTELSEALFRVYNLNRWMCVFELSR